MALPRAPALDAKGPSLSAATAADAAPLRRLLARCGLPVEDIGEDLSGFIVARKDGALCGAAALEALGDAALLRSVAVEEGERGKGLARALCERLVATAREKDISRLYLLTTGAQEYFARLGFAPIPRESAPAALRATTQFASVCPQSAVLMMRVIR